MIGSTVLVQNRAAVELTSTKPPQSKKEVKPTEAPAKVANGYSSTQMQFQVDYTTSDVVIVIRDKQTDEIVRTIPADAMKNMSPGQLIQAYK